MKDLIVSRIDKYYGYAKKIAGSLGDDLLHHVLLELKFFEGKNINEAALDRYIYVSLRNAYHNKRSKFYKEYIKTPDENPDDTPSGDYDAIRVHKILLELEIEGHERHVQVFKECYFGQGKKALCRNSGLHYRTVQRICNLVKEEIKDRYDN